MKPAISVGIECPEASDLRSVVLVAMLGLLSLAAVLASLMRDEKTGGRTRLISPLARLGSTFFLGGCDETRRLRIRSRNGAGVAPYVV